MSRFHLHLAEERRKEGRKRGRKQGRGEGRKEGGKESAYFTMFAIDPTGLEKNTLKLKMKGNIQ